MRNYNRRGRNNSNGRNTHRNKSNQKNLNPLRSQFDSNGPAGKMRGTAQQIVDKCKAAAEEARVSGERIKAEELMQCAEHYARMIVQYNIDNPAPEKEIKPDVVSEDGAGNKEDISDKEDVVSQNDDTTVAEGEDKPKKAKKTRAKKSFAKKSNAKKSNVNADDGKTILKEPKSTTAVEKPTDEQVVVG